MSVVTQSQTRAMGQRILHMFSDVLNSIVDEFENLPHPTIRAFSVTGSTVTVSFGEVEITGVEESKGAWEFKLPRYGAWTVKSVTPTGETYIEVVEVDDVKKYYVQLGVEVKRYGYRIKDAEADPYERVEYILDAAGMTPAHMDFENEEFEYGSWRDVWFVSDNKPLMLKYDGTVDYYLDPNDYTKREDGETDSDVSNEEYEGNAMAQIPLCWIYRYEDDTYKYEIVCNVKYDENYKAYAHTRADGSIADYFYPAIFTVSGNRNHLRSLSDQTECGGLTYSMCVQGTTANGANWNMLSWSQKELIRTLLVLLSKSTNSQTTFGMGHIQSSNTLLSGTLKSKGQFFGYNHNIQRVKVFCVEDFWGEHWKWINGILFYGDNIFIKMTPEGAGYSINNISEYVKSNVILPVISGAFASQVTCSELGLIPTKCSGSNSTYYCDAVWIPSDKNKKYLAYISASTLSGNKWSGGSFTFNITANTSLTSNSSGVSTTLCCEQPLSKEDAVND